MLMNFSVALERIPMAMGQTRTVLIIGLIGSWAGQVPGVFLLVHFWRQDLVGLFTGMVGAGCFCVFLFAAVLVIVVFCSDFLFLLGADLLFTTTATTTTTTTTTTATTATTTTATTTTTTTTIQAVGYGAICIMYIVSIARTDWTKSAKEARERAEVKKQL